MYITSRIDYHVWKRFIPLIVITALGLLALVKVPGIGFSTGGAARWISIGVIFFQPAELAKLAIIMYTAGWISEKHQAIKDFYFGVLPALGIIGLFAFLILIQPDVGTMSILVVTALVMLFVGGVSLRYFAGIIVLGLIAFGIIIKLEPYRIQRLITFLNPNADPSGIGYQINQALLAIGSGGLLGYGYGQSRQKHNYLPEGIGDSIFAIMAEELGFIRVLLILGLFLGLLIRAIKIAVNAPDTFGKLLVIGIASQITIQALINIAAITGLLPLTGIPLPFISYGSSSLIVTLIGMGIILNVSRQTTIAR
jgi:cell division protein FtsW